MINVKRLTVISLCAASTCVGNAMPQTQETAIGTQQQDSTQTLPAQWNLQACIDYALQQNITIRKNRLNAESAEVDVKTARAALFPSLTASVSQRIVNRSNSQTNTIIDGDNITSSQSKTSYNGSYRCQLDALQRQQTAEYLETAADEQPHCRTGRGGEREHHRREHYADLRADSLCSRSRQGK